MLLDRFVPDIGPVPRFRAFTGPKGRRLHNPNASMRAVHEQLVAWIKSLGVPMSYAHGAIKGRSILTNAAVHQSQRYFYLIDIADAYGSLRPGPVADVLVSVLQGSSSDPMERDELAAWLKRYCFNGNGGLYTGGPASPQLFNLYCAVRLDAPLGKYAARQGLSYSRYLDDLTFSSSTDQIGSTKRRRIREAVWSAGFQLNDRKSQVGLDLSRQPIIVAGVQLQWRYELPARLVAPRSQRRRADALIGMALEGRVSPAVAHGQAGAVYAATQAGRQSSVPAVRAIRSEQMELLRRFPQT
jgi:hypothetical protein